MKTFLRLLTAMAPSIVGALIPGGSILVPFIVHGIEMASTLPAETIGTKKLEFAVSEATNGLQALEAIKPGAVDPTWQLLLPRLISDTYDVVHLVHRSADRWNGPIDLVPTSDPALAAPSTTD